MKKILFVVAGVLAAVAIDLLTMGWQRSREGQSFNSASWKASGFGKGHYNVLGFIKGKKG